MGAATVASQEQTANTTEENDRDEAPILPGIVAALLLVSGCASLDTVPAPRRTIEKIRATRTIAPGYRESSVPFSFVGKDGKPAGYSVELCLVTGGSLLALAGANLPSDFRGLRIAVIPGTTTDRVILIGLAATSRDPRRFVLYAIEGLPE